MSETLEDWDFYNIVGAKGLETLKADEELGTGGSLEIKTWEGEAREDASKYQGIELPACAFEVLGRGPGSQGPLGAQNKELMGLLTFIDEAGAKKNRKVRAKALAARAERVFDMQIYPDRQLSNLPAALEGGVGGTVFCKIESAIVDDGTVGNMMRVVAVIAVAIKVQVNLPEEG